MQLATPSGFQVKPHPEGEPCTRYEYIYRVYFVYSYHERFYGPRDEFLSRFPPYQGGHTHLQLWCRGDPVEILAQTRLSSLALRDSPLPRKSARRQVPGTAKMISNELKIFTAAHSNQNQIWCVNIGEHMFFGSIVGSDYYIHHKPPRNSR